MDGSPSMGRTAAAVLLAASFCLVVLTGNRETVDLPGEDVGSSFVRLSNGQGHIQQFNSHRASHDTLSSAVKPEEGDISALVQEDLDWLRDNSAPPQGAEDTALPLAEQQHRVRPAAAPEEDLFETLPDANSMVEFEMRQVGTMQTLAAKDMSNSHDLVSTAFTEVQAEIGRKTLKEAKAVQDALHSDMEDEEQQVQDMLSQHHRDVAQRERKREASMHAKVMVAQADEKVHSETSRLHKQAHAEKQKVRTKLRKMAMKEKKKDTAASKVALHKLRQKTLTQRRRIEAVSRDLRAHATAANEAVVVEGAQAAQSLQTSKLHQKVLVESTASGVREDLPAKITSLTGDFQKKVLDSTKSHPFKEAVLRHQGRKYNKLRKKVVALTDRLSRLQQDAADAVAKKKFEQDQEQARVVLHRKQDEASDELALARFPKEYRAKIADMEQVMMDEKMKEFRKEREARFRNEESHDEAVVQADQKKIASVKQDLNKVLHHKLASVEASILEEVPGSGVELDTVAAPAVATEPAASAAEDSDGEDNKGKVIELLAEEVAVLQNQQKHLVAALTSKRIATQKTAPKAAEQPDAATTGRHGQPEVMAEVPADRDY